MLYSFRHRPPRAFLVMTIMAAAFLITFRETLEASLVVVIVMTVLDRLGQRKLRLMLWNGVMAGLVASLLVALSIRWLFSSLGGHAEEVAEGFTMLLASGLITWMILWMSKVGSQMRSRVGSKAAEHLSRGSIFGIFLMSFLAVVREGTETVLFLQASILHTQEIFQEVGAIAGIAFALGFSFLMLKGFHVLPLKWVFRVTNTMLILFAAGLLAHGLHEFQEASVIVFGSTVLWDINPAVLANGSYPLLHDHGAIGGTLRALIGYNGDPTVLEVGAYVLYILGIGALWKCMGNREVGRS
ncbi:MAG: high-affinity iron transporter [Candidatus Peregrinibacteria bacterium Greene1014_49]|nr:MAG: high-affinity iron transporter [Candidatus Peregrinibacteria bacterium Greene1014_49]